MIWFFNSAVHAQLFGKDPTKVRPVGYQTRDFGQNGLAGEV